MKRMTWMVAALVLVGGCSQGVSVDNGNPTGTVAGVVLDATSEAPLTGATVSIIAGDKTQTATTDMNGQFAVAKVPSGTFIMTVSQMGFVTAQLTDMLGGAVGNFPVSDPQRTIGPIGLFPSSGTFAVHVIDETGAPVPMLKLAARTAVRQVVFTNGAAAGEGAYEVSATTGADGTATFMGLPVYAGLAGVVDDSFTVSVPPTKVMGTEIYDFLGGTFPFHLNGLLSSTQVIHLAGPNTALSILDSNIEYLRGRVGSSSPPFNAPVGSLIPINGPITIAFNQAIDPNSLRTQFLDADGKLNAVQPMTPTVSLNLVTLSPANPMSAGKRFNLILHAVAATTAGTVAPGTSSELDVTAPFFTQPPSGAPITVVANSVATNQPVSGTGLITVTFELSEPIGVGYGNNGVLGCVAFYDVGGANAPGFDNDPNVVFQGDWKSPANSSPPGNLVCRQTVGAGIVGAPEIDVTAMAPLESNNAMTNPTVVTGFSAKFSINIAMAPTASNAGPCKQMSPPGTLPGCAIPGTGTKVHLIFSRQDSTTTVKRVDGTTVPDTIIVQL
ncbi:MAG TPA: carboxypeptidase regulatory-like domain-containing protein [Polyangia bacterium]|nr:carboxypeptidase regulatory-like domain-containing protein [Polyangia bacterium]